MEIKKSKKADLENKRGLFFQLGLLITLGIVFVAFEWSTTDVKVGEGYEVEEEIVEEEVPPITRQDELTPPPPPPPPQASDILEIVDDDVELEDELEIEDTDMDQDMDVDFSNLLDTEEESDAPIPFFILEDKPEFPGGDKEMFKFIYSNIRYPVICQENGVDGMVSLSFVINEKGDVTNIKVLGGPDANLEREAVRVVEKMPQWTPGKQRGRPVKVTYNLPVRFKLQ